MGTHKQKKGRSSSIIIPIVTALILSIFLVISWIFFKDAAPGRRVVFIKTDDTTGVSLQLSGKSVGILDTSVVELPTFRETAGVLRMYAVTTRAVVDELFLRIPYTGLLQNPLAEDLLTISRFDPDTATFYDLQTDIIKSEKAVSAKSNMTGLFCLRIDENPQSDTERFLTDVLFLSGDSKAAAQSAAQVVNGFFAKGFRFGVASYMGGYGLMTDFSSSAQSVTTAFDEIADGAEEGNAHIGTSLLQASEAFSAGSNGLFQRVIVIVTEKGEQSGMTDWTARMQQGIDRCNALGIVVRVVAVDNQIDTTNEYWLKRAAEQTGGGYYRAATNAALNDVCNAALQDVYFGLSDTDNDEKIDAFLIAKTDFQPAVNGFSFKNFPSVQSESGVGFGMALFSERYYADSLHYFADDITVSADGVSYAAKGYELPDFFRFRRILGDFLLDDAVQSLFSSEYRAWDDARTMTYFQTTDEYWERFESLGFQIRTRESRHDSGVRKNRRYMYDEALIDLYATELSSMVQAETVAVLAALYRLQVLQYDASSAVYRSFVERAGETLEFLKSRLDEDAPAVITFGEDGHAVNATALYQSIQHPAGFRIAVYDSSYTAQTRFIGLDRTVNPKENESKYTVSDGTITQNANPVYRYEFRYDDTLLSNVRICSVLEI